jgi:DNA-binding SARP family transcriptional activator
VGKRVIPSSAWRLQKAGSLVKLLALAPHHRLARDIAVELLWPDVEPEGALRSFYYALHVARTVLDRDGQGAAVRPSALILEGGVLRLGLNYSVLIDVDAFRTAATIARQSKDLRAYTTALGMYAGELLPDDPYEQWVARPREAARELHLQLLLECGAVHQQRGEYAEAISVLRQLVADEPTHEEARVMLMRLHAKAGQRWRALWEYAQLRSALRDELDAEPEAATQHLYAQILAGRGSAELRAGALRSTQAPNAIGKQPQIDRCRSIAPRVAWSG